MLILVREWIAVNGEILVLKKSLKEKTSAKAQLTAQLSNIMKTYSIDNFNVKNGSLVYRQKKQKKGITKKYLVSQLNNFYGEDQSTVGELMQQILDNREEVVKDEIISKIHF